MEHSPISTLDGLRGKLEALRRSNAEEAALLADIQARLDDLPAGEVIPPLVFARRIHRARMRAGSVIGPRIVRDPKWEMLLELYIAHHEHRRVSVSSLCHASTAPATKARPAGSLTSAARTPAKSVPPATCPDQKLSSAGAGVRPR